MTQTTLRPDRETDGSTPHLPAVLERVLSHLDENGAALDRLLRHISTEAYAHATSELRRIAMHHPGDVDRLRLRVNDLVNRLLDAQEYAAAVAPHSHAGHDLDAALRWHAARLHDLAAGL